MNLRFNNIFRIRLDGTRLFKVHLDKTQQTNIEHKTETFSSVYKKLTGQEVNFEFQKWLCKAVCGDIYLIFEIKVLG